MKLTVKTIKNWIKTLLSETSYPRSSREFPTTASEYAKKLNLDAKQRGSMTMLVDDQKFWEELNVKTGEDLARSLAISEYSDVYKDTYGIRPRAKFDNFSLEEIENELNRLYKIERDESPYDYDDYDGSSKTPEYEENEPFDDVPKTLKYDEYESLPKKSSIKRHPKRNKW